MKKTYVFQDVLDLFCDKTLQQQEQLRSALGLPANREYTEFERNLPLEEVGRYIELKDPRAGVDIARYLCIRERIRNIERRALHRSCAIGKKKKLCDFLE